jgi:hypothetical protein
MELLLIGLVTAGVIWLGAKAPMAKVTLYRCEETPRTNEWWQG